MAQADNQDLDYSQPLASLLRTSTRKVHDVLSSRAAGLLGSGELPKDEYVRLLMMFWHVYSALEQALEQHASHPALEPTYNPVLLARTPALSSDISHLLQVPEDAWKFHPIYVDLTANMPQALTAYVDRIRVLANVPLSSPSSASSASSSPPGSTPNAPAQLLSHAYVRYLGDLSGGQSTRYTLAKAYQLEVNSIESAGPGVSFYAFKSLRSNKLANQGEMKRIKEWFRSGVNRVGEMLCDRDKRAIIAEAQKAFEFNAALFECLRLPSSGPASSSSDINSDPDVLLGRSRYFSNSGPATRGSSEKATSVNRQKSGSASHIVMVLLAVYLAHFVWSAGVPELFRLEQWTVSFLTSSTSD